MKIRVTNPCITNHPENNVIRKVDSELAELMSRMQAFYCPHCNKRIGTNIGENTVSSDWKFCQYCGKSINMNI